MKTLFFFLLITALCVLTGCQDGHDPRTWAQADTITVLFESKFMTSFTTGIIEKGGDTELNRPVCQLEQVGSGTDAELGAFDIYLSCCWSLADGSHSCTEGYLKDSDGDILTFRCTDSDNGMVFTADFPYDQSNLCSSFEFTGGTGRFADASGGGMMQCDVEGASSSMQHTWEAKMTLVIITYLCD
jgi:hypothetical protein